jgi:two-component system, NarL family, response regulator YdfI
VRHGVESAACMGSAARLIKVFIFANSTVELARLTAIVRSVPSLESAAASLDHEILTDQLEATEFGMSVVLLEHSPSFNPQNSSSDYSAADGVTRIILTEQTGFADAVAEMKENDSAIRAILPTWAGEIEIHAAIEAVSAGLIVIHPEVFSELTAGENERVTYIPEDSSRGLPDSPIQQLSPRESEVLNLLADGLANKEIAWRLKISEHTVKFHVTSIFNKLDASTRAEAVAIGARRGLIIL